MTATKAPPTLAWIEYEELLGTADNALMTYRVSAAKLRADQSRTGEYKSQQIRKLRATAEQEFEGALNTAFERINFDRQNIPKAPEPTFDAAGWAERQYWMARYQDALPTMEPQDIVDEYEQVLAGESQPRRLEIERVGEAALRAAAERNPNGSNGLYRALVRFDELRQTNRSPEEQAAAEQTEQLDHLERTLRQVRSQRATLIDEADNNLDPTYTIAEVPGRIRDALA